MKTTSKKIPSVPELGDGETRQSQAGGVRVRFLCDTYSEFDTVVLYDVFVLCHRDATTFDSSPLSIYNNKSLALEKGTGWVGWGQEEVKNVLTRRSLSVLEDCTP